MRHPAIAAALILALGNFLHFSTGHQISQTDAIEEFVDLLTEVAPQVVGQTGITGMAIALPLATGSVHRLVNCIDDFGHLNATHIPRQLIAATWTAHTGNQIAATQLGKQLLQVGKEIPCRSEISARDTGPRCATGY